MIAEGFAKALYPAEPMSLAEWSDEYRVLTTEGSSEPGMWRTDRTPYLREIMEVLSPSSPVTDVWFMKGAQIGATEMAVNFVGYIISHNPGGLLFVEPTSPMMRRVMKQRIDPMIDNCPEVSAKLPDRFAKSGGNSGTEKLFPGGMAIFSGANSAAALCSMPVPNAVLDEEDRYPLDVGGEGDPGALVKARTRNFPNAKRLHISTPTIKGVSRIEAGYESTGRRKYHVPCLQCGGYQTIEWERLHWDKGDLKKPVWLECESCNREIHETSKPQMLRAGEWRATKPEQEDPKIMGYHLSSFYSPLGWYSWTDARDDYIASEGKPAKRKTWVNTVKGETQEETGEAPSWELLYARRGNVPLGTIPESGRFLFAGVDVQRDRLECSLWTFGEDLWSYPINHLIFPGDTLDIDSPNSPWLQLDALLAGEFPHELGGTLAIRTMAVDSGYNTQAVYRWAKRHNRKRVAVVKGRDSLDSAVSAPTHQDIKENGKRIRRGAMIWPVGVSLLKGELYDSLRRDPPAPGDDLPTRWVDFPQLGQEYFEQLCAEELSTRINRSGYVVQEWRKTRDRNEALDCAIYARAASVIAGLDRMQTEHFDAIRDSLAPVPPPPEPEKPVQQASAFADEPRPGLESPVKRKRRKSIWE